MTRLVLGCLALLFGVAECAAAEVRLAGKVTNENDAPLVGAKLVVRPAADGASVTQIYADPYGAYEAVLGAPGSYLVDVERIGHFALRDRAVTLTEGDNRVDFALIPVREVFSSVDVTSAPPPIDMDTTTTRETVTGTNILNIPYPTTNNLRSALRIIPGVVQDGQGQLHLNGGTESQTLYTLDGFNITDPLTGRFET
ncbi:MAG: carboxypeptidase regulatory-like domain-containing protein, partial [bacterium]|nr:carboxypeptidase regulatory-like domain-containing protein [bacterium]